MSVLAGQPRNATVVVPSRIEATVLEIQRPALRLLRKLKKFGDLLESNYRQHGLDRTFLEVEPARPLKPELVDKLKRATRFTVYAKDHILFQEGDPIEKLFFVNSGWVRRVRGITSDVKLSRIVTSKPVLGEMVMEVDEDVGFDFLGAGNWLGLDA